ncbi:Rap30/74 interaction domain-containing protein [Hesseltinella vesiculosa]|uniref:Transcription initiation factor IIF subunit alpha n=1 Tax=Hesseltinella vesiculosa TaxID=101127 RepID=A0A1X2GEP7_9FUNG|nr:Rap30/74 interaction domain-containing protein [Hesseltinella vesiculosa]
MNQFARPVKLHRKDPNVLYYERVYQNRQNNNYQGRQQESSNDPNTPATPAGNDVKDANGQPSTSAPASSNNRSSFPYHSRYERQNGPRTGADTSLIAPMGGAIKHKQLLFKKRTRQIYLSKDDTRDLKEQEYRPWVLEDYDAQHSFTGSLEGGQRSDYVLFVLTDNGFKVVSLDRWYKFQQRRNIRTMTADEAEEQMKKEKKLARHESTRWMMIDRLEGEDEPVLQPTTKRFRVADTDGPKVKREDGEDRTRDDSDIDDIDFDDVFQDDEEVAHDVEVEDDDVKEGRQRIKKEIKGYGPNGDQDDDDDDMAEEKLTSEGKQLRKLVRDLEKNRAYESDEERDPYASSADDMDTDVEEESEKEDDQEKSAKKKLLKKGLKKKEGLSKPIGRPGSPSLHHVKREHGTALGKRSLTQSASRSGSSSPSRNNARSPAGSLPSSPLGALSSSGKDVRKRKVDDQDGNRATKLAAPDDPTIITEAEVIDVLRNKPMTTKEFLLHFRKRIKKNEQNKTIVASLLKKIARRINTDDPNVKSLELKPEYA